MRSQPIESSTSPRSPAYSHCSESPPETPPHSSNSMAPSSTLPPPPNRLHSSPNCSADSNTPQSSGSTKKPRFLPYPIFLSQRGPSLSRDRQLLSGHELVSEESEREEIPIGRDAVLQSLQRHIAPIAEHADLIEMRGAPEIADPNASELVEEEVVGLQVEVNHAVSVQKHQRLSGRESKKLPGGRCGEAPRRRTRGRATGDRGRSASEREQRERR